MRKVFVLVNSYQPRPRRLYKPARFQVETDLMRSFSKIHYYAASVVTLLTGFRRPFQILSIFLNRPGALPAEVALRRAGWRFQIRAAMDAWIIKETCLDADYLWASGPLKPDWTVLDIGAGLGDFTIFAAKQCPQGIVHAYEPLAKSFTLLQHNLALNSIHNAQVFPKGVASQPGMLAVDAAKVEAVSTRFASTNEGTIPALGLSQVVDSLPSGQCDFLKIDCEGCEFDMLLNSPPETLARIHRLSLEVHDGFTSHSSYELVEYLQQQGFRVARQPNPVHTHLSLLYAER